MSDRFQMILVILKDDFYQVMDIPLDLFNRICNCLKAFYLFKSIVFTFSHGVPMFKSYPCVSKNLPWVFQVMGSFKKKGLMY